MPPRGHGRIFQRRSPRRPDGSRTVYAGHWIEFRRHREAAGCACPPGARPCERADDLLLRRRAAKEMAPVIATEERLTVNDALDAYALAQRDACARTSPERLARRVRHLRAILGSVRILTLRPEHFARYRSERGAMLAERGRAAALGLTVAQGTVSIEMAVLSASVHLLHKQGRLLHAPFVPVPKQGPARRGFLEPEVFARLLPLIADGPPTDLDLYREAAEFKYQTGRRYEEVAGLRWEWVFLRDGEIRWPSEQMKNGDPLTLPLVGRTLAIVERRARTRRLDVPYVFHLQGARMGQALRRHIIRAGREVGVEVIPHDFRRSAARNLIRGGASETIAMSITGHRSRKVFTRYNIVSTEDQRRALKAAAAYREERVERSNVVAMRTVVGQSS